MRNVQFSGISLLIVGQCVLGLPACGAESRAGAVSARILRYPAVSQTQVAFAYAGDIWLAPKDGGQAARLSSPRGEESFPRFSPDGRWLAFSGHYDGNLDIYVVPVTGGVPVRLTHHGAADRLVGWYPDGQHLLFASQRTSPRNRFNQLFKVAVQGGLPDRLPVPYGEFGDISPDGRTLAYIPISVDFRTWKRYRGGMTPDIWLFDLETFTARNATDHASSDAAPMWHGDKLYFLSDRDENQRANLWVLDTRGQRVRQVTHFQDYDVQFPSIGPEEIVFENAGRLYLLDLKTEKAREVSFEVVTDLATLRPRVENAAEQIHAACVSPTGKRAVFQARGDLFSLPAEHGVVRNLTHSSGVAERYPSWSPDGKSLAYFSDRTGEYELTLRAADGKGEEQTLTQFGPGYRYRPQWSPDSRKLVFIDQTMRIWLHDLDGKTNRVVDRQLWRYHGELERFRVSWSSDSRWFAYPKDTERRQSAIAIYELDAGTTHQVTSGFYDDDLPVFDPDGKYLFFRTGREFKPIYSDLDHTWIYANTHRLAAVPLRTDVPSPLAPRNDDEPDSIAKDKKPDKDDADGDKNDEEKKEKPDDADPDPEDDKPSDANRDRTEDPSRDTEEPAPGEPVKEEQASDDKPAETRKDEKKKLCIDLDGFEQRVVLLPTKAGRYEDLCASSGKLIYRWLPRTGAADEAKALEFYDLEKRETKRILPDADDLEQSADRKKLLVRKDKTFAIIEAKEGQNLNKKLGTGTLETLVNPAQEWQQIFTDAWRLQRDYFYDPSLHGVDWEAMRERYGALLRDAVTRWDVNYVIGELIAELNSSHTYRSGGDLEKPPERPVGYLGCDFVLTNGAYRIDRILRGAVWDAEMRSPLDQPGLTNVAEGDYLLAVNGEPLDTTKDPWAAFQGLSKKTVALTVNAQPNLEGAHEVLVELLETEDRLRYLAWVEENRLRVEHASDGRIGYVYVPDTGQGGQSELVRQYRGQTDKEGVIIDERFNSGGQIPDRFVELLDRPLRNYWGVRDGADWPWPPASVYGPKAMLINGWSGSGGDGFPYYFKQSGLGPLIGMRTWGGLIGITGSPPLIDGGSVTVPTFGIFSTEGEWIIEGYGVDPDIEVVDDPGLMARGGDPQLERAIAEVMKQLKVHATKPPARPRYPDRSGR